MTCPVEEQNTDPAQVHPVEADAEEAAKGPGVWSRVHSKLHANPWTAWVTKVAVTVLGLLVMLAGVVMMVTPGPGIVGIALGLAILSLEWPWAERWLAKARASAQAAAEKARHMDPAVRRRRLLVAGTAVVVVVAAGGVAVWAFGLPDVAFDGWGWIQGLGAPLPDLPDIEPAIDA